MARSCSHAGAPGGGVTPRAGEVLLCGAHMPLYPVEKRARLTMTVEGVGEVSFEMK